jgi:hypothetical protein
MRYQAEGTPLVALAGKGVRLGLLGRLDGHGSARRAGCDREELQAHAQLEPGRLGVLPLQFCGESVCRRNGSSW